jgi:hypothetical protein
MHAASSIVRKFPTGSVQATVGVWITKRSTVCYCCGLSSSQFDSRGYSLIMLGILRVPNMYTEARAGGFLSSRVPQEMALSILMLVLPNEPLYRLRRIAKAGGLDYGNSLSSVI